ncbi:MAG: endonuclease [Cytophagales bacterium]|nr:endonuclease [Cytophagales bacterium]
MKIAVFALFYLMVFFSWGAKDSLVIAFYNTENLFDTLDTPQKNDGEYLPKSQKEWNHQKYNTKLKHTARVILALNQWKGADIVGLCEVENKQVLEELVNTTYLQNHNYGVIHFESPDKRGIDVGLVYKKDRFNPIFSQGLTVYLPNQHPTRQILYVVGLTSQKEKIHLLYNHWPSRRGGEALSTPNRLAAANVLKKQVNYILERDSLAKIIIAGDFNDEVNNQSVQFLLNDSIYSPLLYAPIPLSEKTHKYQQNWHQFDFFLLSSNFHHEEVRAKVFQQSWLCIKDEVFLGQKPFRTYFGKKYIGGYSDHFPIKMVYYF